MSYTILNEQGRWEVGSVKRTKNHIQINRDEDGIVTQPLGLAEQEANDLIVEEAKVLKDSKQIELDTLVVEANTVPFDGDIQSIGYMSSVLALANFKMIQAVSSGLTMSEAYDGIYKTIIQWKNANDSISDVQLETVAEALEQAMMAIAVIKTT